MYRAEADGERYMRDPLSKLAAVGASILGGIILAPLADGRGEAKKAASIS